MTRPTLLSAGWTRCKEYAPAVIAASVMYSGVQQILATLRYPLTGLALVGINTVIHKSFPSNFPLANYYTGVPWHYQARILAGDLILLVVGMFIALWVNTRNRRRPA